MEKIVEEVFKVFSHLARDIQTYIIAGFIVLADVYLIDKTYYSGDTSYQILHADYSILMLTIAAYITGQICLAFYSVVLEFWGVDKWLYKKVFARRFPLINDANEESLIDGKGKIFTTNKEVYFHFIERNVNLATLRWNYSSAFFICCIVNLLYCLFAGYQKTIFLTALIALFLSWSLMVLHIITMKENIAQINKLQ